MSDSRSTHDVRERIVEAALRILHDDGAAALNLRNITQAAGCSTTGVYTYFGGKRGLVEAIYLDGFASFDEAVGAGFASGDLWESGLAYRAWALAHPTQYMVMFGRAVPDFEPSPAARERALTSFLKLVSAMEAARPGAEVVERAYHYWATVHGYVMLEIAGMAAHEPEQADALYERALRTLAGTDR